MQLLLLLLCISSCISPPDSPRLLGTHLRLLRFRVLAVFKSWLPREAGGRTGPLNTLLTGAAAGALAHTLTYPLDTIRRRMQISGALGAASYTNALQCVRLVLAEEGLGAFFYGLAPTVIRSLPNLGIQFLLYETLKTLLGF